MLPILADFLAPIWSSAVIVCVFSFFFWKADDFLSDSGRKHNLQTDHGHCLKTE